ncbi:hypothetical protein [Chroococcidiopsis sp.]|uniref:hypothetical protein n=1 Tax=Chroococcidiopsis sp. TaxID=3088168 RepID=UPI003F2F59EF
MGDPPTGMSLERIDNSQGYSKENCRWATTKEQARNKRTNRLLEHNNEIRTVAEWAEILGIRASLITARIDELGWSVKNALTTPPGIHCGKLNPEQVKKIIQLRSSGLTFLEIGRIIGCTQSTAHKRYQNYLKTLEEITK